MFGLPSGRLSPLGSRPAQTEVSNLPGTMSPFSRLIIVPPLLLLLFTCSHTHSHTLRRDAEADESGNYTATGSGEDHPNPVWWHACSGDQQPAPAAPHREEPSTKFVVSENYLETLIRFLPSEHKRPPAKEYTMEARLTLTRRTISVRDTFRSTSFRSLNPKLATSNMSLAELQPYLVQEMRLMSIKAHWLLFKLRNTGKHCFGPLIRSIKELLCARINCFPQNRMHLRWWLPKFQSLVIHNASKVFDFKRELEAIELFVQMVAATLESFHHNEHIMNGPYLALINALNQCTLDILCSLRLLIEQLEAIKELKRVPMGKDVESHGLFSHDKLLYRRGKSVMRPMYRDRMLEVGEKVSRDLLPDSEQVILKEPEQDLRLVRLASVAFDMEALFNFMNE